MTATSRQNSPNPAEHHNHPIHIYIDGDGRPFLSPAVVARDPSPRTPYVYKLMRQDKRTNMMIGRPCYHGLVEDPACNPSLWTTHRYSAAVVASMVAVALKKSKSQQAVLIGHSGGATLALLMAPQMPNVVGLVTVAGNLDVAAWTAQHGFTALHGSLDPADYLAETASIPQIHYFGAKDRIIPESLAAKISQVLPPGSVHVIAEADHACCWPELWQNLLAEAHVRFEQTD